MAGGIVLAVFIYLRRKFSKKVTMVRRVDGSNPMGISPERKEKLISFNNSGDTIILILEGTSIVEDPSWNYRDSDTYQWNQMVTEQGAYASKPLVSLVNDVSDFVERIFQRLDTRIRGAGHYEVVAKYFGFDIFEIRSSFDKSVGGPSRAMIEAIVVRHPKLTVEKFARVVEEKARRKDVADLLRAYDHGSLEESVRRFVVHH
ncbi:uncharacterized protein LOC114947830 isoform X3 [Acropora millepora]|uniref:uncharacterized protein LOC114947830 isoform X3 n=1 Tax=Acropora millepora TaxID=45264 RepID=UPI001CF542F1|nr:uncharacterized protein LOC114947830 isoform X3 [Acropora millepora]